MDPKALDVVNILKTIDKSQIKTIIVQLLAHIGTSIEDLQNEISKAPSTKIMESNKTEEEPSLVDLNTSDDDYISSTKNKRKRSKRSSRRESNKNTSHNIISGSESSSWRLRSHIIKEIGADRMDLSNGNEGKCAVPFSGPAKTPVGESGTFTIHNLNPNSKSS